MADLEWVQEAAFFQTFSTALADRDTTRISRLYHPHAVVILAHEDGSPQRVYCGGEGGVLRVSNWGGSGLEYTSISCLKYIYKARNGGYRVGVGLRDPHLITDDARWMDG